MLNISTDLPSADLGWGAAGTPALSSRTTKYDNQLSEFFDRSRPKSAIIMFYGLQNAGDSCQEGYACGGVSQMREPPACRCGRLDRTVPLPWSKCATP